MKADTDSPEENAFELDGLVIKTKAASGKAPSKKAPKRRKAELFARITERHSALLAKTKCVPASILFHHLMMYSITVFNRPFELPVEHLTKKTGLDRRRQLRLLRVLVGVEIVRVGRETPHGLPVVNIPGTTKPNRKAI